MTNKPCSHQQPCQRFRTKSACTLLTCHLGQSKDVENAEQHVQNDPMPHAARCLFNCAFPHTATKYGEPAARRLQQQPKFTTCFSPNSLLLGVLNALKNGRLGAGWSGRVPGRLVSHFLSFVSQFFSFVSQARCLWSGSRLACLPLPTSFHLSPSSFHLSPKLGACGRVRGWLVSHFLSFVSHFFSFVSQFFSFVSQAGCLWSGSRSCPTSFHLFPTSFHLSPRLGACGRVPGLVSHFLSCVSHFFSFVSHFFSFVSQAGCLWSGSRLPCLPLPFICFPLLFICLPVLFICLPRLGACGRFPGWLVSHFLSYVSQAGFLWSGFRLACLPLPFICLPLLFICLPGWVLVVGFPAGLSPTSCHLSPRLGACGRVPGWLVSHFLSFVSHFFSFPKQFTVRGSQCFKEWSPWCWMVWSGSRPACLPLPCFCLPVLFICLSGWVLVVGFLAGLSPTSFHSRCLWSAGLSPTSLNVSPTSFQLTLRLGACGPVFGWLVAHFLAFVSHFLLFVSRFFSFVSQAGCL